MLELTGNQGRIVRSLVALCAKPDQADRINVSYSIDQHAVSIIYDPMDLVDHPERRKPLHAWRGRTVGVDLNPNWIGVAAVTNLKDATSLAETNMLEHLLIELGMEPDASAETVREVLAGVCDRIIGLARKYRAGTIVLEKGLGKLRGSGRSKKTNRLLNSWAAQGAAVRCLRRRDRTERPPLQVRRGAASDGA